MTPDEAWKGLHQDLSAHDIHIASILAHHRRIIEAAVRAEQWEDIRAESAGTLDVERLARALGVHWKVTLGHYCDMGCAPAIAAEYARLAEADRGA